MEDIKGFVLSMFSKKFLAFIAVAWALASEQRWTELVAAFAVYCGAEVTDKKVPDRAVTVPEPVEEEEA